MVASIGVGLAALRVAAAPLVVLPAALVVVPADVRIGAPRPVGGGEHDLDLVQLIPLGVGPVSFRNGPKLLQAALRGRRLRRRWRLLWLLGIVHGDMVLGFALEPCYLAITMPKSAGYSG